MVSSSDMPKFETVLDMWLENTKVKLKESSYVKYFNLVNKHIKPTLGQRCLSDINNMTLNSFAAEKLKSGKLCVLGGLSEKTVKDIITLIKSVLHFAQAESLLSEVNIILPREKKTDMRVLSKDEQATLEKNLCDNIDECKLGILLCLYTGLRIGDEYVNQKLKNFQIVFHTEKRSTQSC